MNRDRTPPLLFVTSTLLSTGPSLLGTSDQIICLPIDLNSRQRLRRIVDLVENVRSISAIRRIIVIRRAVRLESVPSVFCIAVRAGDIERRHSKKIVDLACVLLYL